MDRIDGLAAEHPDALRRRLMRRLTVAGVLIVILLGALAVFDRLSRLETDDAAPTRPAAKAPPAPDAPTVGPSVHTDGSRPVGEPPPPPIQPSLADTPPAEPKAVPVEPKAVPVEPPPKPEVAAQPVAGPAVPTPAVPPPAARPPAVKPASPVAAPAAPPAVPEGTAGGEIRPAAPVAAAAPVPAPARPLLPLLKRGYVLQAGVFTNPERAEELRARLVLAGVPVSVESRVQVGPFATAQEAAAAREKIRAFGVEAILIPPPRGRAAAR